MARKAKDRRGGYRHGVPGKAPTTINMVSTIDRKDRWRAAAARAGFTGDRALTPFIVEAVESYIKARKLEE